MSNSYKNINYPEKLIKKNNRHFPSSVREWNNSIYLYNKNNLNLVPMVSISAMKIIRSYFNFFNKKLERKMRSKRLLLRLRRLSSNRIYISKGEFKHTNNKVLINLYIFNRQKYNYIYKLKNIYINKMLSNIKGKTINLNIIRKLKLVYKKSFQALKEANKNKYLLIKSLDVVETNNKYKISTFKRLSIETTSFYKKLLNKSLKRLRMYFFYKQLLYLNRSKLNYTYLHRLKIHLENIYNKNVEFNLINLKRFYLNSDTLSEFIKLKITRNRKKLLKTMNKMKNKIKINKKSISLAKIDRYYKPLSDMRLNKTFLSNFVLANLKYRDITGFRLEAKGRLTKRYTASRSISKVRYKGNLLNIDSSYRGLSTVMLRGNLKSNVQFTKSNSKSRIGSFGLKGWISGN